MITKMFDDKEDDRLGRDKNLDDINQFVKPILNNLKFDVDPVIGAEAARRALRLSDSKQWSQFSKRFQKEGSGNLHRLFPYNTNVIWLNVQIYVVDKINMIGPRVRFNIPRNLTDTTTDENRRQVTLQALGVSDVYVLLYVKTGWFIFMRFEDIPAGGWNLTYHNKSKSGTTRLNRMYVKPEYLEKRCKHILMLENELMDALSIIKKV
jgi:hypothetical protein